VHRNLAARLDFIASVDGIGERTGIVILGRPGDFFHAA